MCRLVAFVSREGSDADTLAESLREAARRDRFAERLGFLSHDDGWGYAFATRINRSWSLHFYKASIPMWSDPHSSLSLRGLSVGFMHARKASRGMPRNTFSAHPYFYVALDDSLIFLGQNGGINWDVGVGLLKDMGRALADHSAVTDTYVFGLMFASHFSARRGIGYSRVVEALKDTISALVEKGGGGKCMNTAVLVFTTADEPVLAVSRYVADPGRLEYCELFHVRGEDSVGIVSSTVAGLLEERGFSARSLGEDSIVVLYPEFHTVRL